MHNNQTHEGKRVWNTREWLPGGHSSLMMAVAASGKRSSKCQVLTFPEGLAALGGRVTKFWPMKGGASQKSRPRLCPHPREAPRALSMEFESYFLHQWCPILGFRARAQLGSVDGFESTLLTLILSSPPNGKWLSYARPSTKFT